MNINLHWTINYENGDIGFIGKCTMSKSDPCHIDYIKLPKKGYQKSDHSSCHIACTHNIHNGITLVEQAWLDIALRAYITYIASRAYIKAMHPNRQTHPSP